MGLPTAGVSGLADGPPLSPLPTLASLVVARTQAIREHMGEPELVKKQVCASSCDTEEGGGGKKKKKKKKKKAKKDL